MSQNAEKIAKIYFELTNHCNFKCDFCPINVSYRKRQHMDFSLYKAAVKDIADNQLTDSIGLHLLGEPLMYPDVYQAIEYVRNEGLQTQLTTNGSLLTKTRTQNLVHSGLNKLTISLQMFGETDHALRQSSMPFDRYYRRIMEAIRLIQNSDKNTEVLLVLMNTATQRFIDFDKPLEVIWDRADFRRKLVTIIHDVCQATDNSLSIGDVQQVVRDISLFRADLIRISNRVLVTIRPLFDWGNAFTTKKVYPARIGYCSLAFSSVAVLSNGEVTICCADYDGKTSLGNINDASLSTLLSSSEVKTIAEEFNRLKVTHPYCQQCLGGTSRVKSVLRTLFTIGALKVLGYGPGRPLKEVTLISSERHTKSQSESGLEQAGIGI